jgi:hypothetical protein
MVHKNILNIKDHYDVCIAGAGAAGISLAYELSKQNKTVLLIESGEFSFDDFFDSLKSIDSCRLKIKDNSRERIVGGNTTTWGGLVSTLDRIDFENREWVSDSLWPISYEELFKFYKKIDKKYNFPDLSFLENNKIEDLDQKTSDLKIRNFKSKLFLSLRPEPNFQKIFKKELEINIDILVGHSLEEVYLNDELLKVNKFKIFDKDAKHFFIDCSDAYVLTLNAVENARVLLNSNKQIKQGIGNQYDNVGRYFMNHPKGHFGMIKPRNKNQDFSKYWGFMLGEYSGFNAFVLEDKIQIKEKLLNSYIRFEPFYSWTDNEGVSIFVNMSKRLKVFYYYFININKNKVVSLRDFSETDEDLSPHKKSTFFQLIRNTLIVVKNTKYIVEYIYFRISNKTPRLKGIRLRNIMEMRPSFTNVVKLSEGRNVFGYQKAIVDYDFSELDKRTIIKIHEILDKSLRKMDFGEVVSNISDYINNWPINYDSSHHLGTTRMGNDKNLSVVDKNLKVHGLENLYIAGGSVFPTSGNANPVYTIVALSIRLAEHLNREKNE